MYNTRFPTNSFAKNHILVSSLVPIYYTVSCLSVLYNCLELSCYPLVSTSCQLPKMMNRNESDRQGVLCFLIKNRKTLKTIFIACKKSYDKAVVETQVLGVKPPQICKKTKEKCPKVWGMQKTKYKRKKKWTKKIASILETIFILNIIIIIMANSNCRIEESFPIRCCLDWFVPLGYETYF